MDNAGNLMEAEFLGIPTVKYFYAFVAVFSGFLARWIVSAALGRTAMAAEKTRTGLDDLVLRALMKPAGWACVLGGVYAATMVLPLPRDPLDVRRFADALMRGFSVILVIWLCLQLLDGLMSQWQRIASRTESRLDDQLVPIVRSSSKTFLVLIGIVLFLQNLGYSVTSLLAGMGIGGMAIALASKDAIANMFGSVVLFVDRPFQVGDWIEMGDIEGTVEEVGIRTTKIRTFANSLITTPNALFTTSSINNWSRMRKRRIMMTIGVTYGTPAEKVQNAVDSIRRIIQEDDKILNDFYLVNFDAFGPYSLDILVYCFTSTTVWGEYLQAKQEFMLKLMREFEKLEIEFAFPTQSIHLESIPPGARAEQAGGPAIKPEGEKP